MNLACLVDRDRLKEFETGVVEAARGFNNDFAFDFNGPWPPHNFVDVELSAFVNPTAGGTVVFIADQCCCFHSSRFFRSFERSTTRPSRRSPPKPTRSAPSSASSTWLSNPAHLTEEAFDERETELLDRLDEIEERGLLEDEDEDEE